VIAERSAGSAHASGPAEPNESTPGDDARPTTRPARPAARTTWRSVAVPIEHGGWGLTLEPVLLGLLLVPSGAGVVLGGAALGLFLARTPAKVVLVDRFRHRTLPRTRVAAGIAAVELAVVAVLVAIAVVTSSASFWVPLAVAVPLVGLELWFDMRSRSRRLVPELAGTVGIGSVGAAIVLAGGGGSTLAAVAWSVVAARAVASLPFVRAQLARAKHGAVPTTATDVAQIAVLLVAVVAGVLGWWSWPTAAAVGALAAGQLVLVRRPPPRAVVVGVQQLLAGLAVMIVAGLTLH
jgi:hypothetical protein